MGPEYANIFLADDEEKYQKEVARPLIAKGYSIRIATTNLIGALTVASMSSLLGINIAILDGNFTMEDTSCADGERVAELLRSVVPDIYIIAYSGSDLAKFGNIRISKTEPGASQRVLQCIQGLPNPAPHI